MEKTNGIWSHKDGALKCGSEVVANYNKDIRTGWDAMRRLELFDWVCKTLNEQEGREKKSLIGYDRRPWPSTVDADVWATEFCNRNIASDKDTMRSWFASAISRRYDIEKQKHDKDCNHTLSDEFILLLKKNGKQVIMNGLDGSKTAKLHLEKVIMDGKKVFKLVGFENIPMLDQLPIEYKCGGAYFFFNRPVNSISLIRYIGNAGDKSCVEYKVGDIIQPETLEIFKRCAERLASINKKLKEVKPERFTVKI